MIEQLIRVGGVLGMCAALGGHFALAGESETAAEAAGTAVSVQAKLLKDAEDAAISAQDLQPIALDSLRPMIDPANLPGSSVSTVARTLGDLDPAEIPDAARSLRGTAQSSLPAAAARSGSHSLPPAAQSRRSGRGRP